MTPIHGTGVVGSITKGEDIIPIFCAEDCTFSQEKEVIEASTVTSGVWKENRLRKRSWAFDISGITKINNDDGQESYFDLILSGVSMAAQTITIDFTDDDGNNVSISGTMYLQKDSITGPAADWAIASASFIGTGAYVLSNDSSSSGGGGGGPTCNAVGFSFDLDFPDDVQGNDYIFTIPLTGDEPFDILGSPIKPDWMDINISGSNVVITNNRDTTMDDVGTGIRVAATIENCDGANTQNFDKTVNVLASGSGGRNVIIMNQTGSLLELTNDESTLFSFPSGTNGNFQWTGFGVITVTTMTGTHSYDILQSLPSTIVESGSVSASDTFTPSDLSNTNYIRFNA